MRYRGSNLVRWIVTTASKIFGTDSEDRAGVGPFSLPLDHPFTKFGKLHDWYFIEAREWIAKGKPLDAQTLGQTDMKMFRGWVAEIYAQPTIEQQLELVQDLCAFWPAARKVGRFLWQGPKEPID